MGVRRHVRRMRFIPLCLCVCVCVSVCVCVCVCLCVCGPSCVSGARIKVQLVAEVWRSGCG